MSTQTRPPTIPAVLYEIFVTWLQIAPADARKLCKALWRSRWSEARQLVQLVGLFTWGCEDPAHLFQEGMRPTNLVRILENLNKEGKLAWPVLQRILACVLVSIDDQGRWR